MTLYICEHPSLLHLPKVYHTFPKNARGKGKKKRADALSVGEMEIRSKLLEDIAVPHIHRNDERIPFIIPNDADIHVDAAFKQLCRYADAFGAKGWVFFFPSIALL